ncbi:MAG: carboxypeptidase-like regulatory domain-containing protein [Armatimonadota bacterium]
MSDQSGQDHADLQGRVERLEARLGEFSDAAKLTDDCLNLLAQARAALATDRLPEAHDLILHAECLISRAEASSQTLHSWGAAICIYEVVFLIVLLLLALRGDRWLSSLLGEQPPGWLPIAPYCLWGALGGVIAGLFGFYRHAAARDFDRGYVAYYFLKPIVGLVLGPLVYLFARAGLVAVQADGREITRPELLYLGAFVLGFGERYSLDLIDRVAGAIFGPKTPAASTQVGGPTAAGTSTPATSAPAPAATGTGSIAVTVSGPAADDMHDVSASLLQDDQAVEAKGPPPDEGSTFTFDQLPSGSYQVMASKPGWQQTAPVNVEVQSSGEAATAEVTLQPQVPQVGEPVPGD